MRLNNFNLGVDLNFKDPKIQEKIKNILEDVRDSFGNLVFSGLKVLGHGAFGLVFEGNYSLNPSEIVAIKFQILNDPIKKDKENKALKIMNELNNQSFDVLCV